MYEYITGRIETLTPASVVVEAAGVGYFLNISLQTFSQIGSRTEVKLYAHFAVREDAQVLYGFFSRAERDIFRSLIGVSGVGGNTARMILSSFTAEEVCTIVATGQADVLKTVKGLGLKTAQKIIVELRDKIGAGSAAATSVPVQGAVGETFSEAVAALTMLGFTRQATEKALRAIQQESPAASVEELVRIALKRL